MHQTIARYGPLLSIYRLARFLIPCLAGISFLAPPSLAQTPTPALIQTGDIALDLVSATPSFLGLDTAAIERVLCSKAGVGECAITLAHGGSPTLLLTVTQVELAQDGGAAVSVVAKDLNLAGTSFPTVCGEWSYRITLAEEAIRSTSLLNLSPAADGTSSTALFDGTVTLPARLKFISESDLHTVIILDTLSLHLNGNWTTAIGKSLPPGFSNLMLMIDRTEDGWIPQPTVASPIATNCGGPPPPTGLECPICAEVLNGPPVSLIPPTAAGVAQGSIWFPMEDAFDAQPTLTPAGEPTGGNGGSAGPYLPDRVGYIDFGPNWQRVRITSTWTRYRTWTLGDQTPYAELWWDDDTDSINDGSSETRLNFNSAQGLETGLAEPWLRDRDLGLDPVTPQARYLLARAPADMTNRAQEYAILGYIEGGAL